MLPKPTMPCRISGSRWGVGGDPPCRGLGLRKKAQSFSSLADGRPPVRSAGSMSYLSTPFLFRMVRSAWRPNFFPSTYGSSVTSFAGIFTMPSRSRNFLPS